MLTAPPRILSSPSLGQDGAQDVVCIKQRYVFPAAHDWWPPFDVSRPAMATTQLKIAYTPIIAEQLSRALVFGAVHAQVDPTPRETMLPLQVTSLRGVKQGGVRIATAIRHMMDHCPTAP